jgi:hypothetical protein
MKYKHDRMLPIHAFQRRGSVIGGRGMRLHGDADFMWGEPEPQEDPNQTFVTTNHESGAGYYVPAPPPPSIAPLAPVAPTPPPAAPAAAAPAYTPFAENQFGYDTDEASTYANAARLANWHMSRGDPHGYAQQFIDQANQGLASLQAQKAEEDALNQVSAQIAASRQPFDLAQFADSGYARVAELANWHLSRGDPQGYAQQFINEAAQGLAQIQAENKREADLEAQYGNLRFGTGFGQALGYDYGIKNSYGDIYQKYDAQGNLTEYLDKNGKWVDTSVIKPTGFQGFDENGNPVTGYKHPDFDQEFNNSNKYAPLMSPFREDQGGFLGEGGWSRVAGLVAAGLTAGVAGGAFASLGIGGAGAAVPGTAAAIGTAAAKGALTSLAVSGLQGASPQDMLKSGVLGAVSAGAGNFIGGAELGALGTKAARVGLQTGLAAISGGNVEQALVSSIINNVLPDVMKEVLPSETMGAFNSLPDPIKKIVMSTAGSVMNAGFNGQDISDAATNGVVNGMINLGKDFAKGAFNSLTESELAQTVKGYFNPSSTAGDFTGAYEDQVATLPDDTDVVNNIFRQDAEDVFNRNMPPLVQNTVNLNTPVTAETVLTPPLIQTAMNQTNPDDVYNRVVNAFNNPQVGAPLGTLASATTSDSIITLPDGTRQLVVNDDGSGPKIGTDTASEGRMAVDEQSLGLFNEILQDEGYPDFAATSLDDRRLLDFVNRANARIDSSNAMSIPSPESTANAIDAFVQAGGDTRAISSSEGTQSPEYAVTEAFKAFFGRNPTDIELNRFAPSEGDRLAPQEYLKNVFDYAQQEKQQELEATFVELPPLTQVAQETVPVQQKEQVEPERVKPAEAPKVNAPKGGSGTQGGSLAGDQGRVGAAAPLSTASPSQSAYGSTEEFQALDVAQTTAIESQSVASELASLGAIEPADIPIVTANLNQSSRVLNVSPTAAVTNGLVTNQGTLSDKGVEKVASDTGLSTADVENAVQGSSTIEVGTGSGLKSEGTGAAKGTGTGVSGDKGLGGNAGTGVGGQGTGVGTGVGAGSGSGSGSDGGGSGSYGMRRLVINPPNPGALPGNLEGTYLKGVDVDAYDPFENYNTYQQIAPINAAQGGSPLQLMQLQQGIVGGDPRQYSAVQNRPTPNYFRYGADTSSNTPTTFAGSQLMGKPKPSIPVTPTGNIGANDWLYGAAGTNQLSPAGAGIPNLPSGMMAKGGMAHGGLDEGEHIPEFITGATGHYVRGRGDGQSDDIPAMLADGEYVFDSSAVSTLGNGSSDAGAKLLDAFRETLREHTRSAPKDKIPPKASPLQYMQEAMKKVGMA